MAKLAKIDMAGTEWPIAQLERLYREGAGGWVLVPESFYYHMLGALPPIYRLGGGFSVSEPWYYQNGPDGGDIHLTLIELSATGGPVYYARYMTAKQYPAALAAIVAARKSGVVEPAPAPAGVPS